MSRSRLVLVVVALVAFAFAFQGTRGIWEPDEGRYTDIATQMLRSGNFLIPAYNEDVLHLAKPPVTYWAIAGGIAVAGWNEWGARLPNALAFILTVLLAGAVAGALDSGPRWRAAVVFATCLLPYMAANVVTTDTLLTLFETAGMAALAWWWRGGGVERRWLVLGWAAFGGAFLTKGPPGLLPVAALVLFLLFSGSRRQLAGLFHPAGLAAFAVVGLGWYLAVILKRPDALRYFLVDEVVKRVATGAHHRNSEWWGALKVYAPTLLIGALPWTWVLLRRLGRLRGAWRPAWWRRQAEEAPERTLLLLWFLVPFLVLCIARSRLPLYVLPLFVPLAVLVSRQLGRRPSRATVAGVVAWAILLMAGRGVAAFVPSGDDARPLAEAILTHTGSLPKRVLFVDCKPVWGTALYLKAEVEGASTGEEGAQELRRMLSRSSGAETVLVLPKEDLETTVALVEGAGRAVEPLGDFGQLTLLRLGPADSSRAPR